MNSKLNSQEHPAGSRLLINNADWTSPVSALEVFVREWTPKGRVLVRYKHGYDEWWEPRKVEKTTVLEKLSIRTSQLVNAKSNNDSCENFNVLVSAAHISS